MLTFLALDAGILVVLVGRGLIFAHLYRKGHSTF